MWTTWVTSSVGVLRGVTWTEAGSVRRPSASRRISSEKVAEKSRFWRLRRQEREDLADVADEAHVEHPVGLVEDEDLDPRQVDRPLADVVEQPAGRGDDDLGTGAQRADLRIEADAAVDGRRADGVLGAVGPDALLDLERELAGRGEDQARGSTRGPPAGREAWRRWSIGRTNAAVLPVPVWAPARTSRPARTSGIAWAWTGVGSV